VVLNHTALMSLLLYVIKKEALRVRCFGIVAQLWSTCHDRRDRGVNAVLYGINPKHSDPMTLRTYRTWDYHPPSDIDIFVACILLLTSLSPVPFLTTNHKLMAALPNLSPSSL
jgi:hypothetical protein